MQISVVAGLVSLAALAAGCRPDTATKDTVDGSVAMTAADAAVVAHTAVVDAAPADVTTAGTLPDYKGRKLYPKSWNDPRILKQLASKCSFDPDKLSSAEQAKELGPRRPVEGAGDADDDLGCTGDIMGQSCTYDPCADSLTTCNNTCVKACDTCKSDCQSTCSSCESACSPSDEACRDACAVTTGRCHQACLASRDSCGTKKCEPPHDACSTRKYDQYKKLDCASSCGAFSTCADACQAKFGSKAATAQLQACRTSCAPKGKEACDFALCM